MALMIVKLQVAHYGVQAPPEAWSLDGVEEKDY